MLLEPAAGIDPEMRVGQSVEIVPELRAYGDENAPDDMDYAVISDVDWNWDYDPDQVEVRDVSEDGTARFILTRKGPDDTDVHLNAQIRDDNGEWRHR